MPMGLLQEITYLKALNKRLKLSFTVALVFLREQQRYVCDCPEGIISDVEEFLDIHDKEKLYVQHGKTTD